VRERLLAPAGGEMKHDRGALRRGEAVGLRQQVAGHDLQPDARTVRQIERVQIAARPREAADVAEPVVEQRRHETRSDETRGAGDEDRIVGANQHVVCGTHSAYSVTYD